MFCLSIVPPSAGACPRAALASGRIVLNQILCAAGAPGHRAPDRRPWVTLPPSPRGVLVRQRDEPLLAVKAAPGDDLHRQIFEKNHAVQLLIDPQSGRILEANPA